MAGFDFDALKKKASAAFDVVTQKATEAYGSAKQKGGELYEATKIKVSIADANNDIKTLYREIGEMTYAAYKNGASATETITAKFGEVERLEQQIADWNDQLEQLKTAQNISETAEQVVDGAREAAAHVGETVSDLAETVADGAREAVSHVGEAVDNVVETVAEEVQEHDNK